MNVFNEGTLVRTTSGFKNAAGQYIDPDVVTLKVTAPGAIEVIYVYNTDVIIVKDELGLYHADLDTTAKPGIWKYAWVSTGVGQAAAGRKFDVRPLWPT